MGWCWGVGELGGWLFGHESQWRQRCFKSIDVGASKSIKFIGLLKQCELWGQAELVSQQLMRKELAMELSISCVHVQTCSLQLTKLELLYF